MPRVFRVCLRVRMHPQPCAGIFLRRFDIPTDVVGLLDEWSERFFEELDYVREGQNATRFAAMMEKDLPQVNLR